MDPAQMAHEACRRFEALHSSGSNRTLTEPGEPLLEVFDHLGTLDGWAKIAMARLENDPQDARAGQELRRSMEHTARLHPHFNRKLIDVLADRPAVKTNLTTTVLPPSQPATGVRAGSENHVA
jgi:hypothetical protein